MLVFPSRRMLGMGGASGPRIVSYSEGSTGGVNASTFSINKPAGTQSGDLLIAVMGTDDNSGLTGPTGWTARAAQGTSPCLQVATLVAGSSEPASYAINSGTNQKMSGAIICVRDALFDVVGTIGENGNPVVAPSLTAVGGLLFAFYLTGNTGTNFSTPSGMQSIVAQNSRAASYGLFSDDVPAGATGTRSSTLSGTLGPAAGILLAVKDAV